jgi:hypothetical protein
MRMGSCFRPFCSVVIPLLASCDGFDPALLEGAGQSPLTPQGGTPMAPAPLQDAGNCFPQPEYCNGEDDDCDSKTDEGAEASCRFDNAVGACSSAGACVIAECAAGFLDCDRIAQNGCERSASGPPCVEPDAGMSDGPDPPDPPAEPPDAGSPPPPPSDACVPATETCDSADNDCDTRIDENLPCAQMACVASTPSYRGMACDECVCDQCGALLDLCQEHTDATWRQRCRELVECYVVESRAGNCGGNNDCYQSGNGPCAAEINLAAGGSSGTDTSQTAAGCAAGSPPAAACAAATNYRDSCTLTVCMSDCP